MRTLLALSVLSLLIGAPAFAEANKMTSFEPEEMTSTELLLEKSRISDHVANQLDLLFGWDDRDPSAPAKSCVPESIWFVEAETCGDEGAAK